jgi:hypothetical protein
MSFFRRSLPVVFLAAACGSSAARDAEKQYEIASKSGTYSDVCATARRTADAWLAEGNQERFEHWRLTRDIYCETARRDPGGMPSRREEEDRQAQERLRSEIEGLRRSDNPDDRALANTLANTAAR